MYSPNDTAVVFVDPYNDFLAEGGKLWPYVKDVAEKVNLLDNLKKVTTAAREGGYGIFIAPHRHYHDGDFEDWQFVSPDQQGTMRLQPFKVDTWGGEFHPDFAPQTGDVVCKEHWGQNSFANTDLHLQLTQHGCRKLVFIGLIANTCIEATARYAMELGYHVTLVTNATAAMSEERMHAAHHLNGPNYAHAIIDADTLVSQLTNTCPA